MTAPRNRDIDIRWDFRSLPQFAQGNARHAIGIARTGGANCVTASLVRILGRGLHCIADIVDVNSSAIDNEVASLLDGKKSTKDLSVETWSLHRLQVAELLSDLVRPIVNRANRNGNNPLVIGVQPIGVWIDHPISARRHFETLCNGTQLAESTDVNVVDDLPLRDLACGGRGGPTHAWADWVLLADRSGIPGSRNHGVVRFGPTVRLCVIPSRSTRDACDHFVALDVCPGRDLIMAIAELCNVQPKLLMSTEYCVQGTSDLTLLNAWRENIPASRSWEPLPFADVDVYRITKDALVGRSVDPRSLAFTLVRFISERIKVAVRSEKLSTLPVSRLILADDLEANRLFLTEIGRQIPDVETCHMAESFPQDCLDSAGAALMAIARIDQVVTNSFRLTKTTIPRILGNIIPGNPKNWERLVRETVQQMPDSMKLKEAI